MASRSQRFRKQKGERIETSTAWSLRYYVTDNNGKRRQKQVKLGDKSDLYRSWSDVEPLIERVLAEINSGTELVTGQITLSEFVEGHYLPWCEQNKAAATVNGYRKMWEQHWKTHLGKAALVDVKTAQITRILTGLAKGFGSRTLGHIKWFLSGVYQYAIALGAVPTGANPVPDAKWLQRVSCVPKQPEYKLADVMAMLRVLEPVDIRAAAAVGLAYFCALRPAEIRGLQWPDWAGNELHIRRSVWRNHVGEGKTEDSIGTVPVIEPLRSLLARLHSSCAGPKDGYMFQNGANKPLSLDSLNYRIIAPTLKKAGLKWAGYYACRRGISSLVTHTSKDALNSTGLLRHSNPITALRHYTRAQKEEVQAAMKQVEELALNLEKKATVQ